MIDLEELKLYLPQYLSDDSEKSLFENLKDFPNSIDSRMYSDKYLIDDIILQGDGLKDFLVINLPETTIKNVDVMILSNSCDIALNNKRMIPASICYCPIINLEKYEKSLLSKGFPENSVDDFISSIKSQKVTQVFYLPKGQKLENESFVFLDKINSRINESIPREDINQKKLFTLDNYGIYLFLFKLSIHFSRIRENVDRNN